jgi:hypothetical protein
MSGLRDKTVDWRDGVPIWDDSISHYKDKNFYDYFLDPTLSAFYVRELDAPVIDTKSMITTLNEIEDLLIPRKPSGNLWFAQDLTNATDIVFNENYDSQITIDESRSDGCPFETDAECAIWQRKPMVRETVAPRSYKIRSDKMNLFADAVCADNTITANMAISAPLLERYKILMASRRACCTDGMVHSLKNAGASDDLIYKFMSDDANFYGIGARCLMMSDSDIDAQFSDTTTAAVVADVRQGCLCRGRQWFNAMLAPFNDVYNAVPEFADAKFYYSYTDGLGRAVKVSVNNDVQNVMHQLEMCP